MSDSPISIFMPGSKVSETRSNIVAGFSKQRITGQFTRDASWFGCKRRRSWARFASPCFGRRRFVSSPYLRAKGNSMRVARWGNSLAVRLPKTVAEQAQLQEGAEIDIAVTDGRITIQRRPPAYSLDELVEQVTPDNRHDETDWGEPQGDEVW
jgi:antitoxin MazE